MADTTTSCKFSWVNLRILMRLAGCPIYKVWPIFHKEISTNAIYERHLTFVTFILWSITKLLYLFSKKTDNFTINNNRAPRVYCYITTVFPELWISISSFDLTCTIQFLILKCKWIPQIWEHMPNYHRNSRDIIIKYALNSHLRGGRWNVNAWAWMSSRPTSLLQVKLDGQICCYLWDCMDEYFILYKIRTAFAGNWVQIHHISDGCC